jgi:DNA-binding CsgD family transcriptional regulator
VDEAWALSGAASGDNSRVHLVVPAHIGKAAYHHAAGEFDEAIRVGEAGLAIAENTGYIIWAAHRLLPLIGEAYLQIHDAEAGLHIEKRMRRYGKKLNTKSGLAWLAAYEAVKTWYRGDIQRATVMLRKAAESLEDVPMIYDAARLRRQLAGRLADLDKRDAALEELRLVHDVFQRIGAEPELKKTRGMFRELDTRPPSISKGSGAEALSQRELEIARLVARRKSNKAIAKELGISPRTVSTHLSNTFQKLEIGSRGELADYAREYNLLSEESGE